LEPQGAGGLTVGGGAGGYFGAQGGCLGAGVPPKYLVREMWHLKLLCRARRHQLFPIRRERDLNQTNSSPHSSSLLLLSASTHPPCTAKPTRTLRPQTPRRSTTPSRNTSRQSRNSGVLPRPRPSSSNTRPLRMATSPDSPPPPALAALADLAAREDRPPPEPRAT
jgi:hypothetical protein